MRQKSPIHAEMARGTPIKVYGRTFTPVARVVSVVHHNATIGADRVDASGWGVARTQPVRLLEERDGATYSHAIPDRTRTITGHLALVALVFPVLCAALIAITHWLRELD